MRTGLGNRLARRAVPAVAGAAAALAALAPACASGAPTWSGPEKVGPGAGAEVAIDAQGNALLVTQSLISGERFELSYSWRRARGRWSPPRRLAEARHGYVDLGITPHGRATVLWSNIDGRLLSADSPGPGQRFGAPVQVAPALTAGPALAVDDEGNAVAAWADVVRHGNGEDKTLYVAERPAGRPWEEGRSFGPEPLPPKVAVNPSGAAVVAWGFGSAGERFSYRQPGGEFGPPEQSRVPGWFPEFALGDNGHVIATAAETNPQRDAQFAVRDPVSGWAEPVGVGAEGWITEMFAEPSGAAAMFLQGAFPAQGGYPPVGFALRSATGQVIGPIQFASEDTHLCAPASNRRGDNLIPLVRRPQDPEAMWLEVADRPAGSVPLPPVRVNGAGEGGCFATALNDAGHAVIVGLGRDGVIRATVREERSAPPPPPDLDLDLPAAPGLSGDGGLSLTARCDTGCRIEPTGIVFPGGGAAPARGRGASKRLRAHRRGRVTLRFDAADAAAVRNALAAGRRPWVSFSVTAKGKSPRRVTVSRRVKLKPR